MARSHALLAFCRNLPHATEDIKWGKDLCFSIGGKMFAVFDMDHLDHVGFKTTPATFAMLTKQAGIIPAPYAARFHWVAVRDPKALPRQALKELIEESYNMVAAKLPRKVREKLGME
jgi:predicted DNA-binding protein (MmcQ/YjbR family)